MSATVTDEFPTVPLDFNDFYLLMKLKINYQRHILSQVMMRESIKLAALSRQQELTPEQQAVSSEMGGDGHDSPDVHDER